ncbi:tyrosine-type recombinase/integrase [Streptococcus hongkongensis]
MNYQKLNDLTNDFVFISKKGNHLSIDTINRRIKKTPEKIFGIVITSHLFRHGYITLLAELGILLKSIMNRVGHTDVSTTIKIYTHTTEKWVKSSCKSSIILINYKKLPHNCPMKAKPIQLKQSKHLILKEII